MRIVRNERHIRARRFIGRYAVLAGLLVLLAGLLVSLLRLEWITFTAMSVVPGFVLTVVGGFLTDRYVGPLAHHDALVRVLKGFDDRYVLLQYVLPAPHVLLEPGGLTTLLVKAQGGQVTCEREERWKHQQRGKFFRQLAGQEGLGIPDYEAQRRAVKLERWLAAHLPDAEVPVRACIVFVNPDLTLDAAASPVPAFYGKKVKAWLRGPGKLPPLPAGIYDQLAEAVGAVPRQGEEGG